jgi:hypothetical protein
MDEQLTVSAETLGRLHCSDSTVDMRRLSHCIVGDWNAEPLNLIAPSTGTVARLLDF